MSLKAAIYLYILLVPCQVFHACKGDVSVSKSAKDTCPSTDPDCNTKPEEDNKLVQLQGVQTGFVQYVNIEGITYKLITRSMKPLLFEIPAFLTEEECDRIVQLAKKEGLEESLTLDVKDDLDNDSSKAVADEDKEEDVDKEEEDNRNREQCSKMMEEHDADKNGHLSAQELSSYFDKIYSPGELKEYDVKIMFEELDMDKNRDGEISVQECVKVNVTAIEEYIAKYEEKNPLYKSRYSQQAWLQVDKQSDPVLVLLRERIVQLTKLPRQMIENSEHLQVVRYSVHGHFHAHYDSSFNKDKPCCVQLGNADPSDVNCNLCRFATILYYLNNVTDGGETAFPIADNSTYDQDEYDEKDLSNLSTHCHQANIVVKPVKGTAILWYNHHLNPDNADSMGEMDKFSLHGGCDVRKGIKWIANNWLNANMQI